MVYLVLIIIQVLFGINFATSKVVVSQLDPFVWSNIRFLCAGFVMFLVTVLLKRPHPQKTKEFFLPILPLSLLGMSLGQGLFLFGLNLTSSINTAIITSTIPLITMVIVVLRKQENLTKLKVIGFLISFAGVLFIRDFSITSTSSMNYLGDMLVFLGAACFALYLSYGKNYLMKFDNLWVTTYMFLASGLFMLFFNLFRIEKISVPTNLSFNFWMSSAYTIIGATVLTYFLNNWSLRRVESGNVALFIYLQPVIAGIIGFFFLGEIVTLRMLISSLFIILGMSVTIFKSK